MPIAKKATKYDSFLKVLIWGDSGSGKTRLALSFPDPLVADLERGTRLYADQFSFMVAEPSPQMPGIKMIRTLVDEIANGEYPGQKTLVIDPITDYLEQIEVEVLKSYEAKGVKIDEVNALKKSQIYHHINTVVRDRLDTILRLPMNVVFVARAKKDFESKQPVFDTKGIVEYLSDIVIQVQKGGQANVKKSRIRDLPATIRAITYADIQAAFESGAPKQETASVPQAQPAIPEQSKTLTTSQLGQVCGQCKRLFGEGEEADTAARKWISDQLKRDITSRKEITEAEAVWLIKQMNATKEISIPQATTA